MRPDTPQKYEYILIEDITGNANHMLDVNPWMQFFDLKGEIEMKVSQVNNITFRNIELDCNIAFNIKKSDQYNLSSFLFENINISEKKDSKIQIENIQNSIVKNTIVNGENLASLE